MSSASWGDVNSEDILNDIKKAREVLKKNPTIDYPTINIHSYGDGTFCFISVFGHSERFKLDQKSINDIVNQSKVDND